MATILNAVAPTTTSANMRMPSWANVGKTITASTEYVGGIPAEMAFSVRKEPMGFNLPSGEFRRVEGVSTIVNNATNHPYGAVSDKYHPIDNVTALGVLQYMDGLDIVKYGETYKGMQFIIGKLPETTVLGDSFVPYLIFRNSFNGRFPIQAAITPLRIVCQNQFAMAFKNASNTFAIRHSKSADKKLQEAQQILCGVNDFMKELNAVAEQYATQKISRQQEAQIIASMFPITDDMTDRTKRTVMENMLHFQTAIARDDNANFTGTAWGLINAYTDYLTHPVIHKHTKTVDENNFVSVSFDTSAINLLLNAIKAVA